MKLRNLSKMQRPNDGSRSLFESVMAPEVIAALKDWTKHATSNGILIGGLAVSYYIKPRYTQDVDFLFLSDDDVPVTVPGFKRTRTHAFLHLKTHVEVELVTPEFVKISRGTAQAVISSSHKIDGVKVASPSGLVALKLSRLNDYDRGDIKELVKLGNIDISGFDLTQVQVEKYLGLLADMRDDLPGDDA